MKIKLLNSFAMMTTALTTFGVANAWAQEHVDDSAIAAQREALAAATENAGYGPQSPRDLGTLSGENERIFQPAPPYSQMNLCNIHFHKGAEHKGGEFTVYAGNGDGKGYGTGYLYSGELTEAELMPVDVEIGNGAYGGLKPGDTIELHYVHTSAQINPGPTLGACLSDSLANPQLRVEGHVFVLVNDTDALDFGEITSVEKVNGYHQAVNMPHNMGEPIEYPGSTTGPTYNSMGSPLQVSWSVRPNVAKVDILSVGKWLDSNIFEEKYAHGVRNLVVNPALLSNVDE